MNRLKKMLSEIKPVIGMIHIQALPGTPNSRYEPDQVISIALDELDVLTHAGVDAIMIENMHDLPYLNRNVGPEITSMMAILARELRNKTNKPIGIQILAGANKQALAVAHAASLDFIRAEGYVFSHIADEGLINSDAGEIMRYRKTIGAQNVMVLTDIKKKHAAHSITDDLSILDMAKAAEFFASDGVILSGKSTAGEIHIDEAKQLHQKLSVPVVAGSGITNENIEKYYPLFDAFIIGSYFKINGHWSEKPDANRISDLMLIVNNLRNKDSIIF